MALLLEAGLPNGVINLVYGDPETVSRRLLSDPALAGVHFTGSPCVFDDVLKSVAANRYRNYPRVLGETSGKNWGLSSNGAENRHKLRVKHEVCR